MTEEDQDLSFLHDSHQGPFRAWCAHEVRDLSEVTDRDYHDFLQVYRGRWDSQVDFAYEIVDTTGILLDIPAAVAGHFNYDAYARSLFGRDYVSLNVPAGGVWVFRRA